MFEAAKRFFTLLGFEETQSVMISGKVMAESMGRQQTPAPRLWRALAKSGSPTPSAGPLVRARRNLPMLSGYLIRILGVGAAFLKNRPIGALRSR
jgi:hypothetical protein